jgi:hypothetical protein
MVFLCRPRSRVLTFGMMSRPAEKAHAVRLLVVLACLLLPLPLGARMLLLKHLRCF